MDIHSDMNLKGNVFSTTPELTEKSQIVPTTEWVKNFIGIPDYTHKISFSIPLVSWDNNTPRSSIPVNGLLTTYVSSNKWGSYFRANFGFFDSNDKWLFSDRRSYYVAGQGQYVSIPVFKNWTMCCQVDNVSNMSLMDTYIVPWV